MCLLKQAKPPGCRPSSSREIQVTPCHLLPTLRTSRMLLRRCDSWNHTPQGLLVSMYPSCRAWLLLWMAVSTSSQSHILATTALEMHTTRHVPMQRLWAAACVPHASWQYEVMLCAPAGVQSGAANAAQMRVPQGTHAPAWSTASHAAGSFHRYAWRWFDLYPPYSLWVFLKVHRALAERRSIHCAARCP